MLQADWRVIFRYDVIWVFLYGDVLGFSNFSLSRLTFLYTSLFLMMYINGVYECCVDVMVSES